MTPTRHEVLIQAGWRYDVNQNYYTEPGSAIDGTARRYDQEAAWMAHQVSQEPKAGKRAKPSGDPRRQEPQ